MQAATSRQSVSREPSRRTRRRAVTYDNVRSIRMNAAKRAGTIDRVLERSNYRCHYCGKTSAEAHTDGKRLAIDHVHPLRLGGDESDDNLVAACGPCNSIKGTRTVAEARHGLVLRYIGWPKFTEAQIDWLRASGFDLTAYDECKLAFERSC